MLRDPVRRGQALQILMAAFKAVTGGGILPSASIAMACIQSLYSRGNLTGPGCCAGTVAVDALPLPPDQWRDELTIIQLVRSLDMAGRINPESLSRFWAELGQRHPIGMPGATNVLYIASSPTRPRPTPPLGSSTVAPLIIGTLHDPATTYTGSQQMASFFPKGVLLTWQG